MLFISNCTFHTLKVLDMSCQTCYRYYLDMNASELEMEKKEKRGKKKKKRARVEKRHCTCLDIICLELDLLELDLLEIRIGLEIFDLLETLAIF